MLTLVSVSGQEEGEAQLLLRRLQAVEEEAQLVRGVCGDDAGLAGVVPDGPGHHKLGQGRVQLLSQLQQQECRLELQTIHRTIGLQNTEKDTMLNRQ